MRPITLEDLKTINGAVVRWKRLTKLPFKKAERERIKAMLYRQFNVNLPPDPEEPSNVA